VAAPLKFGQLLINHPGSFERKRGEVSTVTLSLFTPQGHFRETEPLTEDALLKLIEDAARYLRILRA
jgi:hypothetical protein